MRMGSGSNRISTETMAAQGNMGCVTAVKAVNFNPTHDLQLQQSR